MPELRCASVLLDLDGVDSLVATGEGPIKGRSRIGFGVHGIHLVVRLVPQVRVAIEVHCPRGGMLLYGQVVARGDGVDPEAGATRALPSLGSIVVFEEDAENGPGHEVVAADSPYRIITLDDVLLALIPRVGLIAQSAAHRRRRAGTSEVRQEPPNSAPR